MYAQTCLHKSLSFHWKLNSLTSPQSRPSRCPERCTSAVPEIHMSCWVVFAQALQNLLVVDEAMQRPQDEDIQRDVANLLQLKVPAEVLQAGARPARLLQLEQSFRLFVQAHRQRLRTKSVKVREQDFITNEGSSSPSRLGGSSA